MGASTGMADLIENKLKRNKILLWDLQVKWKAYLQTRIELKTTHLN